MLQGFLEYLAHHRQYATLTLKAYKTDIKQAQAFFATHFSIDLYHQTEVANLKPRHLRAWMGQLAKDDMSARTTRRKISALKSYFGYLQRYHGLTQHPASHLTLPKLAQTIPTFLKEEEVNAMLDRSEFSNDLAGARDRLVLELLYGCGLRRSELLSLTLADIDRGRRRVKVLGKGNKERLVPFGKQVSSALETYLIAVQQAGFSADNSLIITNNGQAAYPKLVYRIVRKYIEAVSSLQQRSPHVLRHSYATHMLDRGADLNAIKELLGHSSLAATQVYTHQTLARLKAVHQQAHPRAEQSSNAGDSDPG